MNIESIRVRNFKTLRDIHLKDLPGFCVFVGRNGTGKTTLFRVFAFLKACLQDNVRIALNKEGGRLGFKEVVSRGHADERIEIEIQFRLELLGTSRLVTYILEIGERGAKPVIEREILRYKRGRHGAPYHYLDFSNGRGRVVLNEEDFDEEEKELTREERRLDSPDILAIKGLGIFGEQFKAASAFRQLIENWHVSDFHITDARGKKDDQDVTHLSSTGDNLPAVARYLFDQEPKIWERIIGKMRARVPGIEEIEVRPTEDGGLLMRYRDGAFAEPFIDRNVSDGTIKMFAYLVLLEDPKPFPILCVEEPENQLYPELMTGLAEEFLGYSERGGQVFVSTHSPDFLNATPIDSIYWLEKQGGQSTVYRAVDYATICKLIGEGDLPGMLWNQGLFSSRKLHSGQ
ncbi:MAG: AAA family ATPase [Myxococcota bacterium]